MSAKREQIGATELTSVSTRRKAPQVPSRAKAEQSNQMTSAATAAKATEVSPRLSQAGQAKDAMSGSREQHGLKRVSRECRE